MIDQVVLGILGVSAVACSQAKNPRVVRWSCVLGLLSQPFWFYAAYTAEQWGIFVLCFFYTAAWCNGVWIHWIAPMRAKRANNSQIKS